jgi:hypothetical protein
MDTVTIEGKEVPITELAAAYQRAQTLSTEVTTLRAQAEAAAQQLASSAEAVEQIQRLQRDPEFAAQVVGALKTRHADSAYFAATVPPVTPPASDGQQQEPAVIQPAATVTESAEVLALRKQLEDLQGAFAKDQGGRMLTSTLEQLEERFPFVKRDDLLKAAAEQQVGLESLPLLAASIDRDRLEAELQAKGSNDTLLDQLFGGAGVSEEGIAAVGSSLTTAQLNGDADVDYASMSTDDAILRAAADLAKQGHTI